MTIFRIFNLFKTKKSKIRRNGLNRPFNTQVWIAALFASIRSTAGRISCIKISWFNFLFLCPCSKNLEYEDQFRIFPFWSSSVRVALLGDCRNTKFQYARGRPVGRVLNFLSASFLFR